MKTGTTMKKKQGKTQDVKQSAPQVEAEQQEIVCETEEQIKEELAKLPSAADLALMVALIEPRAFRPRAGAGAQNIIMEAAARHVLDSLPVFLGVLRERAGQNGRITQYGMALDGYNAAMERLIAAENQVYGPFPRTLTDFGKRAFPHYAGKKLGQKMTQFLEFYVKNRDGAWDGNSATGEELRAELLETKIDEFLWVDMTGYVPAFRAEKRLAGAIKSGAVRREKAARSAGKS